MKAHRDNGSTKLARNRVAPKPSPNERPHGPDIPALQRFLLSLGLDPSRDPEYSITAPLLAELLAERTIGLRSEMPVLHPLPYHGHPGETVTMEGIVFYGLCPHHLMAFIGEASVRFLPRERLCGAGAMVRVVRDLATVPRLQENLTQAVADVVERDLSPRGVEVLIVARHLCMELRGCESRARLVTEAVRGEALPPLVAHGRAARGGHR